MGTLFNGHTYTFKKESGDLFLSDSTDHSHETITFRDGIVASGSVPITIKPLLAGDGFIIRSHMNSDIVHQTLSYLDSANNEPYAFALWYYANSYKVYINTDIDSANTFYAKAGEETGDRNVMLLESSTGRDCLKVRKDG